MFTPNHVSVTVVSARNLTAKGKNGKNDAFVVIQLGDKKFQTSVQKKSVAPYWEEECELFYENKYSELILTVYHRNLLGFDEFIGQLRLPLDEVYEPPKSLNPNQRPPNRWFPLKGKSGKKEELKYRGELEVRLLFSRKQPPDASQMHDSKSVSKADTFISRQSSLQLPKEEEKSAVFRPPPLKNLKKDFMGSMPSLVGSQKPSLPPSPTASISSVKKRSLFSRLKPSASFHSQQSGQIAPRSGPSSARSSIARGPTPDLTEDDPAYKRHSYLGPLDEDQPPAAEDLAHGVGSAVSLESDDPPPVITVQKRGGGTFALGGGQKTRPASASIGNDRIAAFPNRYTMAFGVDTGDSQPTSVIASSQCQSVTKLPNDNSLQDASSAEELKAIVNEQRVELKRQRVRIRELEEYIDRLLLRVITTQPELLQDISWEEPNRKRAGSAPFSTKAPYDAAK